jgi:hypothetical protein
MIASVSLLQTDLKRERARVTEPEDMSAAWYRYVSMYECGRVGTPYNYLSAVG